MIRVDQALTQARDLGLERLDAQLLLAHHLQRPRAWLAAHADATLPADLAQRFTRDCTRRARGEPLAYVIGQWQFRGLTLQVSPAVLVPRPETEVLVEWALELLGGPLADRRPAEVVDLGTGSGAIALALADACRQARLSAVDASPAALTLARENGQRLGLEVDWLAGDWWLPLATRHFDLVVSNPPYVATGDPHLDTLLHEPAMALTAGPDGLADLRTIVAGAGKHMQHGAWLLLEHGHDQRAAVQGLLTQHGFADVQTRDDLAGLPRCSAGRWR